jgi:hypothetical protein
MIARGPGWTAQSMVALLVARSTSLPPEICASGKPMFQTRSSPRFAPP